MDTQLSAEAPILGLGRDGAAHERRAPNDGD